jgi:hypothetical protein
MDTAMVTRQEARQQLAELIGQAREKAREQGHSLRPFETAGDGTGLFPPIARAECMTCRAWVQAQAGEMTGPAVAAPCPNGGRR